MIDTLRPSVKCVIAGVDETRGLALKPVEAWLPFFIF